MSTRASAMRAVEDELRTVLHRAKRNIGARAHGVHPELGGASYLPK